MQVFDSQKFRLSAVEVDQDFLKSIERCLILSPHPDDESLGCGGLIAKLAENNCDIKIILTTDGSKSHPNSQKYPSKLLTELRYKEVKAALKILGVNQDKIIFYNGNDSALPALGETKFNENVERLSTDILSFKPQLILVPYELDPHRDHRATWQMLHQTLLKQTKFKTTIWEYPIWLYQNASIEDLPNLKPGELKHLDITEFSSQKEQAIFAHVSQTTRLIDDDPEGFMLVSEMIANFTNGKEYFMERSKLNGGSTLPKNYFESLYTENPDPWDFEKSEYEKEKYQRTISAIPEGRHHSALEIGCSIGVLTQMIAEKCDQLLSIDISEQALETAKNRLKAYQNVEFKVAAIPDQFPEGKRDLIMMSEVGYYLSVEDLNSTISIIEENLNPDGILVLVHWTHFVHDYPLSGDEVHDAFAKSSLAHLKADRTADYRLDVYQKKNI
ncbi:bifunctional PIG-L family deacetylase/class I SAM-dependent methyltransferase [Pedobacter mucosus]|uniref:bifunctional PIG-L family deacetylase/class I SAM-dependent methyltransferase n=1 Tax=Pedobacter mucosus TaxID=2895286 RepID=UPI001EE49C7D|nr:bifunctional PIG-L family deacetylase/class I SAM-dependent methyltransferase [Pedobacter mucosus]UKT64780.1 PIG-L family deacetylase [Pedobacter mucosus]